MSTLSGIKKGDTITFVLTATEDSGIDFTKTESMDIVKATYFDGEVMVNSKTSITVKMVAPEDDVTMDFIDDAANIAWELVADDTVISYELVKEG